MTQRESNVNALPKDPDILTVTLKELLFLKSAIENMNTRLSEIERNVQELAKEQRPRRRRNASLSPLQLQIAQYLAQGSKTQSEISSGLNLPQSSVSHSLSRLENELSIVESRPVSKADARYEYVLKENLPENIRSILARL